MCGCPLDVLAGLPKLESCSLTVKPQDQVLICCLPSTLMPIKSVHLNLDIQALASLLEVPRPSDASGGNWLETEYRSMATVNGEAKLSDLERAYYWPAIQDAGQIRASAKFKPIGHRRSRTTRYGMSKTTCDVAFRAFAPSALLNESPPAGNPEPQTGDHAPALNHAAGWEL